MKNLSYSALVILLLTVELSFSQTLSSGNNHKNEPHTNQSNKLSNESPTLIINTKQKHLAELSIQEQLAHKSPMKKLFKDTPTKNIKLHKFKEESSPYDFIHFLLNQPLNSIIDTEPLGGTVPKYIDELNLKGILGELFIDRLSTYKAAAKANPAYLKDFSSIDLHTLREQIKGLKKVRSSS